MVVADCLIAYLLRILQARISKMFVTSLSDGDGSKSTAVTTPKSATQAGNRFQAGTHKTEPLGSDTSEQNHLPLPSSYIHTTYSLTKPLAYRLLWSLQLCDAEIFREGDNDGLSLCFELCRGAVQTSTVWGLVGQDSRERGLKLNFGTDDVPSRGALPW